MFKNILKTFYRSLRKDKLSFFITFFGFVTGIFSAILLFCYIYYEYNYESVHANSKRIYRVGVSTMIDGRPFESAPTVSALGPYLKANIPEIETFTRLNILFARGIFKAGEKPNVNAENVALVDSTFFDLFTFHFIEGSAEALQAPGQVVLTESLARSLFGNESGLGKLVVFNLSKPLKVGAVINDPVNTHLRFQALISWITMPDAEGWDDAHSHTYFLLNKNVDPKAIAQKINDVTHTNQSLLAAEKQLNAKVTFPVQALTDIHLYSHRHNELSENNNADLLYILLSIAIFLVLISCFNYVNIAISTSMTRSREIGVRKVFGAGSGQIAAQFFIETFVIILVSFIISFLLVMFALKSFSSIMDQTIDTSVLLNWKFILIILGLLALVTIISGSYPSFYLARLNPTSIFSNNVTKLGRGHLSIRKLLIVLQLIISTGVVACAAIAISQLKFITNLDIGFDKEKIVYFDVPFPQRLPYIRQELTRSPDIQNVSLGDYSPLNPHNDEFELEQQEGKMGVYNIQRMSFGYTFVDLMDMKIVKGRNFDPSFGTDAANGFLVNEATVKLFGWTDPIGKKIKAINYTKEGTVVGVLKNASLFSLHRKEEPMVAELATDEQYNGALLYVKYKNTNVDRLISTMKDSYRKAFGDIPFDFKFLDETYDRLYRADQRYKKIISYGSIIMIVISALGLYGLSSFIASRSRSESGIRKVLGASTYQIAILHVKSFFFLSLIGSLIALPIVYYFSWRWLQTFSTRITIDVWMLLGACIIILLVVIFTTGLHAMKLGRVNPAKVLRER